jgi:hypothetical protein
MKFWRRDYIASFTLNGLNENGRYFLRGDTSFKEVFPNPIHTGNTATRILPLMIRAAIAIGIRDMSHPGDQRREPFLVNHFAGC